MKAQAVGVGAQRQHAQSIREHRGEAAPASHPRSNAITRGTSMLTSYGFPAFPSSDSYGDIERAVHYAAPYNWDSADERSVVGAAWRAGISASETRSIVHDVHYAAPYNWDTRDEVDVTTAAIDSGADGSTARSMIHDVHYAAPYNWSTNDEVQVTLDGLYAQADPSDVKDLIHDAHYNSPWNASAADEVAEVETNLGYSYYGDDWSYDGDWYGDWTY